MADKKNWQTDFKVKPGLVQKDVYVYETALRVFEKEAPSVDTIISRVSQVLRASGFTLMSSIEAEHYLKSAVKAGWIESPECEIVTVEGKGEKRYMVDGVNVDDLHAGKVKWYGVQINRAHQEATEYPDPNL